MIQQEQLDKITALLEQSAVLGLQNAQNVGHNTQAIGDLTAISDRLHQAMRQTQQNCDRLLQHLDERERLRQAGRDLQKDLDNGRRAG